MGNEGWVSIHRQVADNWVWQGEKFSKGQAWIDLIISVNHENKKIMVNGKLTIIKKGQMLTSIRKLSAKWGWGEQKTLKFLKMLESDGMIKRDSRTLNGTLLTLINWDKFQGSQNTNRHTNQGTNRHTNQAPHQAQTIMINNENKEIKEKASPFEGLDPNEMDDETFDRWQKWRTENESL